MNKNIWCVASVLALLGMPGVAQSNESTGVIVDLGALEQVIQLYSYPNNCSVICYNPQSLEQTVAHYLQQSVDRDGFAQTTVSVYTQNGHVFASIIGDVPMDYASKITAFLSAGAKAFKGASQILAAQKWAYNWYFFLPQGMALENHKTVELLHFPPDYSLTQAQDYLESKTTDRWADLLVINGVGKTITDQFQTIVDIAPIAAPADAGSDLGGTYSYFSDYALTQLNNWATDSADPSQGLPIVAFGAPVRDWVKTQFGLDLKVLQMGTGKLSTGAQVPILAANHPSYIWYAASIQNCQDTEEAADKRGIAVMGQDLIASCWQGQTGLNPKSDPTTILNSCTTNWNQQPTKVCELFYETVRNLSPSEAQAKCSTTKAYASNEAAAMLEMISVGAPVMTRHGAPQSKIGQCSR